MLFFSLLNKLLSRREKMVLMLLLLLSVIVSAIETFAISAIMVFITLATNFDIISKNKYCYSVYTYLGFTSPANFVVVLGICLLFFYLFRAVLNIYYTYISSYFSFQRHHKFSSSIFDTYLRFNYCDFVTKNSAQLHQIIFSYSWGLSQTLSGLLAIFAEAFTLLSIYGMLFCVNWKMTVVLTAFLVVIVGAIMSVFSKRVVAAGKQNQYYSCQVGKVFTESFWNFKFLKLIGQHKYSFDRFSNAMEGLVGAAITNTVWQVSPRFVFETIGFSLLISVVVYVVFMQGSASTILPVVSMFALAFYRFLPSVNKIMVGYNQIVFNKHLLPPFYEYLKHDFEHLGCDSIDFNKFIEFDDVSFFYSPGKDILQNVSVKIFKGDRVGIMGLSGAGKSTLVDILMGLYVPKSGFVRVDGIPISFQNLQNWRMKIGYIPQTIYLFDGTIAQNVACGRPYDELKVVDALKRAHIYDFLMTKNGIHTLVGEGGVLLSGGQKQRVAIARALYTDPEVLVLDEATSSLDNEVESRIMDEIYSVSASTTLIIIAHRLSTIERCDKIFKVDNGRVELVGSKVMQVPEKVVSVAQNLNQA